MDPNNKSPQGENPAVNKLEQDLKSLNEQVASTQTQPAPEILVSQPTGEPTRVVAPLSPFPAEQPAQQPPEVAEAQPAPAAFTPVAEPVESGVPVQEPPKKGSPLMVIAIILAIVAVLAVVAYVFGAKILSPQPSPTPITTVEPTIVPTVAPMETPEATGSAAPTTTASPSANPTASPVVSPSATP
jgi:hypothetical protein